MYLLVLKPIKVLQIVEKGLEDINWVSEES
jgi:hypothetical protein